MLTILLYSLESATIVRSETTVKFVLSSEFLIVSFKSLLWNQTNMVTPGFFSALINDYCGYKHVFFLYIWHCVEVQKAGLEPCNAVICIKTS